MKNYKKLFIPIFTFWLLSFTSVFAWWIDHFEVKLNPDETNIWEAVDLTIEAVDKNNEIVENYDWVILIFSESDPEAVLPSSLEDNTYSFASSDQWSIKFENAVIFNNEWRQDLYVYDLDDDTVLWVWEILINKVEVIENLDISIISPENWLVIWENSINISWLSNKNHNIEIIINNEETISTTTNNEWIFEYEITWLVNWENTIKANILDSDWKIIWESEIVEIEVNANQPQLKNIALTPESVEIESSYEIEIITNNSVTNASVIINENIIELNKDSNEEWLFRTNTYSPSQEWNYSIWVILKDELWHEITELGAWNIVVTKPELNVPIEEVLVETENPVEEIITQDLTIKWLKVIELKSKSVLSWDEIEWVEWYNVYKKNEDESLELIEKVVEPKFEIEFGSDEIKYEYFAIKAISKTWSWEMYEWSLSDATKVKTWPETIILLLISLMIGGLLFFTKSKKA